MGCCTAIYSATILPIFLLIRVYPSCSFEDFYPDSVLPETREKRGIAESCIFDDDDRCYEELGCFPCDYGFQAKSPEEINMVFYLHTDSNTTNQTVWYKNFKEDIPKLTLNVNRELWVIIHGFEGQWPLPWIQLMTTALLSKGNNVLIARWTEGTSYPLGYYQACSNGRVVGAMTGRFLKEMKEKLGLKFDKTNLVGFSMGVPVAGETGEWLNGTLKQIVGLEPAGQGYEGEDPTDRLDPTDAQMVQAIHTHGAPLSQGGLGTMQAMGDIDIYVNGGLAQPGCPVSKRSNFSIKKFYNIIEVVGCNHLRAPAIFTDSITNPCKYKAYPCDSKEEWALGKCFSCGNSECVNLGYQLDPSTDLRGKFFLSTLVSEETRVGNFCGKNYRVSLMPDILIKGKIKVTLMDGQNTTRRANFQGMHDELPTYGKSAILAAPFQRLTGARIWFDRYNRLVVKSHEIFNLRLLSATSDTGETFGANCSLKVRDDYTVEVDLYPGIGYGGVLLEDSNVENLNKAPCVERLVNGAQKAHFGCILLVLMLSFFAV